MVSMSKLSRRFWAPTYDLRRIMWLVMLKTEHFSPPPTRFQKGTLWTRLAVLKVVLFIYFEERSHHHYISGSRKRSLDSMFVESSSRNKARHYHICSRKEPKCGSGLACITQAVSVGRKCKDCRGWYACLQAWVLQWYHSLGIVRVFRW